MPSSGKAWRVNALALAALLEARPYANGGWSAVEALLRKAFGVGDTARVFEPEGGQPALIDRFQELADTLLAPKRLSELLELAKVKQLADAYQVERIRRVLPFLVPVSDAGVAAPGVGRAAGRNRSLLYRPIPGYIAQDVSYLDPYQGATADCYLISAMIAAAWAMPDRWQRQTASAFGPNLAHGRGSYAFHKDGGALDVRFDVLPSLLVRRLDAGFQPVYAHSRDNRETWAGLLEKAFVIQQCGCDPARPDQPQQQHYARIGQPDVRLYPQEACQMLVGGRDDECTSPIPGRPEALAHLVQDTCCAGDVTRWPTMAWTWSRVLDRELPRWSSTGLQDDHAYAVLGVIGGARPDYVVLRDPLGSVPHRPDAHAETLWQPQRAGAAAVSQLRLGSGADGVFALRADLFDRCFRGVGWVDPGTAPARRGVRTRRSRA